MLWKFLREIGKGLFQQKKTEEQTPSIPLPEETFCAETPSEIFKKMGPNFAFDAELTTGYGPNKSNASAIKAKMRNHFFAAARKWTKDFCEKNNLSEKLFHPFVWAILYKKATDRGGTYVSMSNSLEIVSTSQPAVIDGRVISDRFSNSFWREITVLAGCVSLESRPFSWEKNNLRAVERPAIVILDWEYGHYDGAEIIRKILVFP